MYADTRQRAAMTAIGRPRFQDRTTSQSASILMDVSVFSAEHSGRATLDGSQCTCGRDIKARDIVVASFDHRRVSTGGGLYLVQSLPGSDNEFRACRRMMRVPDGVKIDLDGYGDWATFDSPEAAGWQVVGTVETVYRPTDYR